MRMPLTEGKPRRVPQQSIERGIEPILWQRTHDPVDTGECTAGAQLVDHCVRYGGIN